MNSWTKPLFFVFLLLFLTNTSPLNGQYTIYLQNIFGGAGDDRPNQLVESTDDTYIGFGYSSTVTSTSDGGYDFWIFELDDTLGLNWQQHYGTSNDDELRGGATVDNNWLLVGIVDTLGETVSQHFGGKDAWFLMVDENGEFLWEKTLGTANDDEINEVIATAGGDFLAIGTRESDEQLGNGEKDIWLVKLDATGTVLWERTYGSTLNDEGIDIIEFPENSGNYALCGYVRAADGDVSNHNGSKDYWVAKVDGDGNLLENHAYGGDKADVPSQMIALPDGGLAIVGETFSEFEGFTENKGSGDFLIAVIDENAEANYTVLGGSSLDAPKDMILNDAGNLVVVGETFSMDGDISFFYLLVDIWFCEISLDGEVLRNEILGGNKYDTGFSVIETDPGSYLISGYTDSVDGDLAGKKSPPHGNHFAWAFVMNPFSTSLPSIENTNNPTWSFQNNYLIKSLSDNSFSNNNQTQIRIYNETGQLIESHQTNDAQFGLRHLPLGVYIVEISESSYKQRIKIFVR